MTTSWQAATRDFFIDLGDVLKSSAYAAGHALKTLQEFMWKATVALEDADFKSRPSENAYGKSGITNGESGYSSGISMSQNIRLCASLKYIPAIPKDITEFKRCGGPGKIKEDLKTTAQIVTFAIKPVTATIPGKTQDTHNYATQWFRRFRSSPHWFWTACPCTRYCYGRNCGRCRYRVVGKARRHMERCRHILSSARECIRCWAVGNGCHQPMKIETNLR